MALTKVTGQVIKNTTDVTVGVLTVTNTLAVGGTVSVGGTLTYEDVTNVDSIGLITARNGIVVGSGITLSKDGDIFATGISTFTGGINLGDGDATVSALFVGDSIAHTGNTDAKIRFPETDKFTIETGNTQRLAVEPAGNINIAKNLNVGAAITVGALGAGTSLSTIVGQGFLELTRSSGDTYIDFKNAFSDDFDSRIITNSANQLQFFTGGQGSTFCALQTGTGKVAIATAVSPDVSKLEIHSDKLGATAGNTQELLLVKSPDISNSTTYRFTNYRKSNGTTHVTSELRFRRHVDVTDMGYFGLGDGYASIGYGSNERFRVSNDGHVTKPAQFHIVVQRASNQTGYNPSQGFGTGILYNEVVTTQGTDSSVLNTSNGRITVPVAGIYFLEGSGYSSTAAFTQGWFTKNGSRLSYSDWMNNSGASQNFNASGFHKLAADDTIGFKAYGSAHTNVTVEASIYHTWFRITLVG